MNDTRSTHDDAATDDLVRAAATGDLDAFGRLVERFEGRVRAVALSAGLDAQGAEDLAQETFVAAYGRLASLNDPRAFPAWIVGIARNQSVSSHRRSRLEPAARGDLEALPIPDPHDGPADALDREELREDVRRALASLDERERLALTLRHHAGLTYAEIAETMSLSGSTVKGLMYRGTRALKTLLGQPRPGPFYP